MLSIEQEKLGASFKKMCERFLSNTTAGVFAMIVAQILHARRLMAAAILESRWAFLVLSFYNQFSCGRGVLGAIDYAFKGAAYSPAIFLFGGLGRLFQELRESRVRKSLRITMVSIGIAQTFISMRRRNIVSWRTVFAHRTSYSSDGVPGLRKI